MLQRKQEYLDAVLAQVRWTQAHPTIRQDLSAHMEDQTEAYIKQGVLPEDAEQQAVLEMGDPVEVACAWTHPIAPRT